jgi:hypothetical protein
VTLDEFISIAGYHRKHVIWRRCFRRCWWPNLGNPPLAAATLYVLLAIACVAGGLLMLVVPLLIIVPEEFLRTALHIGGSLVAAIATFPSGKYLQRRDRASALRMISSEYARLERSGNLASPARTELDKLINRIVQGMIK